MHVLFAATGILFLGACSMFPPVAAVEGVTAVSTGKTLSDHMVSFASGKNCSTVRSSTGRSYCEENEANPTPKVWCYRTIGNPVCYRSADPYGGNQRTLGDNSHNTDILQ